MSDGGTAPVGTEGGLSARGRVFVVNHSPDVLGVVRELLQEEQYDVTTATYVPETFERIVAARPDLLLVDVAFGEQAGWDLLARLAADASTRGIPIVVFSTDPSLLDQVRGLGWCGADRRFVAKPFDIDDLAATVRGLIGED
jgi:two-component system sensor histidine kinase and response regulator WspE